jgi:hypothetical protein
VGYGGKLIDAADTDTLVDHKLKIDSAIDELRSRKANIEAAIVRQCKRQGDSLTQRIVSAHHDVKLLYPGETWNEQRKLKLYEKYQTCLDGARLLRKYLRISKVSVNQNELKKAASTTFFPGEPEPTFFHALMECKDKPDPTAMPRIIIER